MAEAVKVMEPVKETGGVVPVTVSQPIEFAARARDLFDNISKRAFEMFERNGRAMGREWDDWFKAEAELLHPAHLHVEETDKAVSVKAEVPGFTASDLQVSLEGNRLTITGRRETKIEKTEKKTVYRENCSDQIMRVIDLPSPVDAGKVTATLKDGMLELMIPKAAPARRIAIEPKAG
jgi:HSP20 family protein